MTKRRCVILERATEFEELIAEHGTKSQAEFVVGARGIDFTEIEHRHAVAVSARESVVAAIPKDWKTALVSRDDLDRFYFVEDDIVIALGQDGLVANLARFLDGQAVIGVNNAPDLIPGVLSKHVPEAVADLMADAAAGRAGVSARTMVEARVDDGQTCTGLNEIFFGHASHQSAKYDLFVDGEREFQSSSGLVVATGTGGTGWAASLNRERGNPLELPDPLEPRLAWFVREPWPSAVSGCELAQGTVNELALLSVTCKLGSGATIFSDGIEPDSLAISYGQQIQFAVAGQTLNTID